MRSDLNRVAHTGVALLLIAAALAPVACARRAQSPDPAAETTLSPPPYTLGSTADSTGTPSATGGAGSAISTDEARRLDAELEAIESELNSLDMPSDSDFSGVEGALQ